MNSHPSGIPSRSESFEVGSIGMMFMYRPGEIPAKIHRLLPYSRVVRDVTRPGILV